MKTLVESDGDLCSVFFPGLVDGKKVVTDPARFPGLMNGYEMFQNFYGTGYSRQVSNTMNFDMVLTQNLDFVTKGLTLEAKGSYNTTYSYTRTSPLKQ